MSASIQKLSTYDDNDPNEHEKELKGKIGEKGMQVTATTETGMNEPA